jgi:glycosyltransferase involved in cell wall biosynthesis
MKVTLVHSQAIHPGVHKMAKTLSQNGHDVKLLVWDRDRIYPKFENIESYTAHRFHLRAPHGKIIVLFYLPMWWLYQLVFLLREGPDVIHACNFDTLVPAIFVKLIKKTKLCYTIYDLFGSVYTGKMPSIFKKLATSVEKAGIAFTDTLFLVTESFDEEIRGARIRKVVYVYNSPEDYSDVELKPKTTSETYIFFAGWMDRFRGLEDMIDAVSDLDGIKLVMAGVEVDKGIVEYGLAKLENFEYLGWIPYEEVIRRSLEADILFVFYDYKWARFKHSTPNKIFEAMMCGKPILISDGIAGSKIVAQEDCGIVVHYGDVDAIKESLLRLKNDPELRQRLGQNGRKAYENRYSWTIMESSIIDAYNDLAKSLT